MTSEQTRSKERSPIMAFVIILLITLVLFVGLGWISFHAYKDIKTIQERDFRLQELIGTITHLDEVLTMSAHMGAETGSIQWEERYLSFEPQLDSAIKEAKRLVPETFMGEATTQTDIANSKLVTMEKQAFELVRQGRYEVASALLISEEYEEQKQIYAEGMKQVTVSMQSYVKGVLQEYRYHAYIAFIVISITLPILIFAWIYVLRMMRKYIIERRATVEELRIKIEEGKRSTEEMRESEERFRSIFEQAAVGIIHVATNGKFLRANKRFCEITGYTKREILGRTFLDITHPDDIYKQEQARKKVLDGKESFYKIEKRYVRKDSTIIWANLTVSLVRKLGGEPNYLVSVVEDITEHKKMEGALLQSEKLTAIGTITSGVAHEFNNILAIISGKTQILEMNYKDNKELTDEFHVILRAARDGAKISDRMLKFTKTEKDVTGFVSHDLRDLIKQSIAFTMPKWKNEAQIRGIDYKVNTEGMKRVSKILCNSTEIREIFINIINNSLDAMPEGGSISFSTWSGSDTTYVSVSDTGEGMSEDVKKRIFDPFFTTKMAVGTGLGMSTAYGIINRHGGKIEVKSELGKGSTFTLQFPTTMKSAIPKEASPEQETMNMNLRILVVDDEKEICEILEYFLSKKGHMVRTANSGREAIILINDTEYDLVLTDMAMPDVYGYEVVKALNKLEKRPKIGIITGWGEKLEHIGDEGFEVDFIIKKPFNFSELTKDVNNAFNT